VKRLGIVLCLLAAMILVSIYSIYRVERMHGEMTARLDEIAETTAREDSEALVEQVGALRDYWDREEKTLILFLRHSHVDDLTRSIMRLPALTQYRNIAELNAELDTIRWQIDHLRDSELPNLRTVM